MNVIKALQYDPSQAVRVNKFSFCWWNSESTTYFGQQYWNQADVHSQAW